MINQNTRRLFQAISKFRGIDPDAFIAAIHQDANALSAADYLAAFHDSAAKPKKAGGSALSEVAARVDRERKKTGIKAAEFVPLLSAEIARSTPNFDASDIAASDRRSLRKFADAAAALVGDGAVIAAAVEVMKQRAIFPHAA